MAPRKKPADDAAVAVPDAPPIAQVVTLEDGAKTTIVSSFGIDLDPVDGRPVFADGISRRRWLELHADERKAEFIDQLRNGDEDQGE